MNDSNQYKTKELLINKSGKGKYCQESAVGSLIRYIARENGMPKDDLVCCGAFGAVDFTDISDTIRQFGCVQMLHTRKGNIQRYIDHEIYSFSADEEDSIVKYDIPPELVARKMAHEIYRDGFQVFYGVHRKDRNVEHLHVHFAVNTVNYRTGKKRHDNMLETKMHEQKFRNIVDKEIKCRERDANRF